MLRFLSGHLFTFLTFLQIKNPTLIALWILLNSNENAAKQHHVIHICFVRFKLSQNVIKWWLESGLEKELRMKLISPSLSPLPSNVSPNPFSLSSSSHQLNLTRVSHVNISIYRFILFYFLKFAVISRYRILAMPVHDVTAVFVNMIFSQ